jgi:hypothetical protein
MRPGLPSSSTAVEAGKDGAAWRFNEFQADGLGYLHPQATRP